MSTASEDDAGRHNKGHPRTHLLAHVSIVFFSIPLGLSSQASLWRAFAAASHLFADEEGEGEDLKSRGLRAISQGLNWAFWCGGVFCLLLLLLLYGAKARLFWEVVRTEYASTLRNPFFMAPLLAASLLALGHPPAAEYGSGGDGARASEVYMPVFAVLAVLFLFASFSFNGLWLFSADGALTRANPVYLMAVIGNFLVANMAASFHDSSLCAQVGLLFFSTGCLFAVLAYVSIFLNLARSMLTDGSMGAAMSLTSEARQLARERSASLVEECAYLTAEEGYAHTHLVTGGRASREWRRADTTRRPRTGRTPVALVSPTGPVPAERERAGGLRLHAPATRLLRPQDVHVQPPELITAQMQPILFLLMAPFGAASLAWGRLSGSFDNGSRALCLIALYLYMFLVRHAYLFVGIPFSITWWALSFPTAVVAQATLAYALEMDSKALSVLALTLAVLSLAAVLLLCSFTLRLLWTGGWVREDPAVTACILERVKLGQQERVTRRWTPNDNEGEQPRSESERLAGEVAGGRRAEAAAVRDTAAALWGQGYSDDGCDEDMKGEG